MNPEITFKVFYVCRDLDSADPTRLHETMQPSNIMGTFETFDGAETYIEYKIHMDDAFGDCPGYWIVAELNNGLRKAVFSPEEAVDFFLSASADNTQSQIEKRVWDSHYSFTEEDGHLVWHVKFPDQKDLICDWAWAGIGVQYAQCKLSYPYKLIGDPEKYHADKFDDIIWVIYEHPFAFSIEGYEDCYAPTELKLISKFQTKLCNEIRKWQREEG